MKKLINPHFILTMCFGTMTFLTILGLFFIKVPEENLHVLYALLGIEAGWVTSSVSYYFGNIDKTGDIHEKLN